MKKNRNALYKRLQKAIPLAGLRCVYCKTTRLLQRHHPDHTKPLEIQVVCRSCHGRISAKERWANHKREHTCVSCGRAFTYVRVRQTACSISCANRAAWKRRKTALTGSARPAME